MLAAFYRPIDGKVLIDGNDIKDIDISWLRNNITVVQQQTILFNETIRQNIALGHQDIDLVTDQQIESSLELAALQELVALLPDGLRTVVGAAGSSLSGGQKQRIAIARARIRDTPVLILDEATSALDFTSRTTVVNNIRTWRQGKTTIVITHDLEQIEPDDLTYVLDAGQIACWGRRKDILDLEKRYSIMDQRPEKSRQKTLSTSVAVDLPCSYAADEHSPLMVPSAIHAIHEQNDGLHEHPPLASNEPSFQHNRRRKAWRSGISASAKAVASNLRRQSTARATIMYSQMPPPPRLSKGRPRTGYGDTRIRFTATLPKLVSRGLSPDLHDKPLPVPPLDGIELKHRMNVGKGSKDDNSTDPISTMPVFRILATLWPSLSRTGRVKVVVGMLTTIIHATAAPAFSFLLIQVFSTFYMATGYRVKMTVYSLAILSIAFLDGIACFVSEYFLDTVSHSWIDSLGKSAFDTIKGLV
jgi:ATP-binding cassette subfamily B (MDR/TAP) protein 1